MKDINPREDGFECFVLPRNRVGAEDNPTVKDEFVWQINRLRLRRKSRAVHPGPTKLTVAAQDLKVGIDTESQSSSQMTRPFRCSKSSLYSINGVTCELMSTGSMPSAASVAEMVFGFPKPPAPATNSP